MAHKRTLLVFNCGIFDIKKEYTRLHPWVWISIDRVYRKISQFIFFSLEMLIICENRISSSFRSSLIVINCSSNAFVGPHRPGNILMR